MKILVSGENKEVWGEERLIKGRNVEIVTDDNGNKMVLIKEIMFKEKHNINWNEVKDYLWVFVRASYKIEKIAEIVHIGRELPEEYIESESRKALMGANAMVACL